MKIGYSEGKTNCRSGQKGEIKVGKTQHPAPLSKHLGTVTPFLQQEKTAWLALVVLLILTFFIWRVVDRDSATRIQERFDYRAEKERQNILNRLENQVQVLKIGRASCRERVS
jgi:hypothetical protein